MKSQKGHLGENIRNLVGLLALFLLLEPLQPVSAATLSATGGWTQNINSSNLTFGAGSDLADTYLSAAAATTLTVSGCASDTEDWQILIKRIDNLWDSAHFVLSVKRTSVGTGAGIISGGDSFQVVGTTDALFITGQGNRSGITVQYQLTGMSIRTSPNNYSTVVEFTITP